MKSRFFLLIAIAISSFGCRKYVDPGTPRTQLDAATVFSNDATATGAMLSVYAQLEVGAGYALALNTGLSSDELRNHSPLSDNGDVANNNIAPENNVVANLWNNFYKYIYQCNLILEKLDRSPGLTSALRRQLQGEALFTRSFCNFHLLQLFGKIPLLTTSDFEVNATVGRSDTASVFQAIRSDLNKAIEQLDDSYRTATNMTATERIRPTRMVAKALLARLDLYQGRWADAETNASSIIGTGIYQLEPVLNNVFLKSSREAIWQWQAVYPKYNTYSGGFFILTSTPSSSSLQPALVNFFQATDGRKASWIKSITVSNNTYYFVYKYKVPANSSAITEYTMVFRLAEQVLIRAEARLRQGKLAGAESDLNLVRVRAGLQAVSGLSETDLLDSIRVEHKRELFVELGDRWFELKRNPGMDQIMTTAKGSLWQPTDRLYPIPQTEIIRNQQLDQNPGY